MKQRIDDERLADLIKFPDLTTSGEQTEVMLDLADARERCRELEALVKEAAYDFFADGRNCGGRSPWEFRAACWSDFAYNHNLPHGDDDEAHD